MLAGRHRQKWDISGRFTNLQLPWLGQGFAILRSSPCIDINASQQLGSAVFASRDLCSGLIPARQHPSDLRSFRSHQSSRWTHQEDCCAVGLLSPGEGEYLGLQELPANQENKAVPSATASFKRLLHIQANNTAFLQRLKSCLHAQRKHLQSST